MSVAGSSPTAAARLSPTSAALLIVANAVGAGIFTTSGYALADLGTRWRVLAAWAVGGAIALSGAVAYGALARRFPVKGGEYLFLREALHPAAGEAAGWVSLLAGFTAPIAAAALALGAYLVPGDVGAARWTASAVILLAGLLHARWPRLAVRVLDGAVVFKLLLLALFIGWAAFQLGGSAAAIPTGGSGPPAPAPVPLDLGAFAVSLVWIGFAYSGWNAAVYVAGEVEDAARRLPRVLVAATLGVVGLYLALNVVFLWAAPVAELAGRPDVAAAAAAALGGPRAETAVRAVVALALFTSVWSMVLVGPRVFARMAADGVLPAFFARGTSAPTAAVALQVALALTVVWIADLTQLLGYLGFTLGLSAALTAATLWLPLARCRAAVGQVPALARAAAIVFVTATLGASLFLFQRDPLPAALGAVTLTLGALLYWRRRVREV